jgi:hypothetical protein
LSELCATDAGEKQEYSIISPKADRRCKCSHRNRPLKVIQRANF